MCWVVRGDGGSNAPREEGREWSRDVWQVGSASGEQLSAQPCLPAAMMPASQERRWSLIWAIKGTGKCHFGCWRWFLRVQLDYCGNCLDCFEVVAEMGVPLAGHMQGRSPSEMQFVVDGFNHQQKPDSPWSGEGALPSLASGHSAVAAHCYQHKPAFISPTVPVCFGNLLFLNTFSYNYIFPPQPYVTIGSVKAGGQRWRGKTGSACAPGRRCSGEQDTWDI